MVLHAVESYLIGPYFDEVGKRSISSPGLLSSASIRGVCGASGATRKHKHLYYTDVVKFLVKKMFCRPQAIYDCMTISYTITFVVS